MPHTKLFENSNLVSARKLFLAFAVCAMKKNQCILRDEKIPFHLLKSVKFFLETFCNDFMNGKSEILFYIAH